MMDSRMKKLAGIRTIDVFKSSDASSIRSLELSLYRGLISGTGSDERVFRKWSPPMFPFFAKVCTHCTVGFIQSPGVELFSDYDRFEALQSATFGLPGLICA
jgi:hypothetical protein